jgi:DNA anti-recombination protein RmuC
MSVVEILTIILLLLASFLCIALIYIHAVIAKSARTISSNFEKLSNEISLFVDSANEVTNKIENLTDEIDSQLKVSRSVVSDVRKFAGKLLNVETKIRDAIFEGVDSVGKNLGALGKGIGSFWKNYKN